MLSIRLDSKREWWVSGKVFERLVQAALSNRMPPHLEKWRHVADANGGFDLSEIDPAEAGELLANLRSTAAQEVQRLKDADERTDNGSYRISLQKFLTLEKSGD